jgi:hypothetical protein
MTLQALMILMGEEVHRSIQELKKLKDMYHLQKDLEKIVQDSDKIVILMKERKSNMMFLHIQDQIPDLVPDAPVQGYRCLLLQE